MPRSDERGGARLIKVWKTPIGRITYPQQYVDKVAATLGERVMRFLIVVFAWAATTGVLSVVMA